MDDATIRELFDKRDESAIDACMLNYGELLHRVSYNILASHEDAEECVQDALHKLWVNIQKESISSLRAYLVALVRNISIQRIRGDAAQKRGGGEFAVAISELENCIRSDDDIAVNVEARELAATINRWLLQLTAEDRILFVRRYQFGDSLALLADELGQTPKKVSKRLYNMREKLRKYLEKEHC